MKRFIQGEHRGQSTLLPESLDDNVADSYNAVATQYGTEHLDCTFCARKFVDEQKVQSTGKAGRADTALNLINKLYGIVRDLK